uniref:Toll-interacting protein B n=1 Tax=Phallusia mammillata TaxID=59560 RepID=A0A6F9DVG1_9ASCI|nr:toll-interacting protein B [Phallusia mammillata]
MAEAPTQAETGLKETSRGAVMLGELPQEFLNVETPGGASSQMDRDAQMAQQLAAREIQKQRMQPVMVTERLFISVIEAKLNKNYGLVKMDPYCRIRVNHTMVETDTDQNGAKNPHWTKPVSVAWNEPIETIYVEIMDEKSLQTDVRIAWTDITLPDAVKHGEQVDDWWPLTGKLGVDLDGTIKIKKKKKRVQQTVPSTGMPLMYPQPGYPIVAPIGVPGATTVYPSAGMPVYYPPGGIPPQQQQPPQPQGPLFTEEDVKQLKEMFPTVDEDVVKTVLEASRGNKDAAINSLLEMQ